MSSVYFPEVVERVLDVQLRGNPPKINCPFHDDPNPSFAVYDERGHCFGCGRSWDPRQFLHELGLPYAQITEWLEGEYFTTLDVNHAPKQVTDLSEEFRLAGCTRDSRAGDRASNLVRGRWPHLHLDLLVGWGVAVGDYNLLIPHHDERGQVVGVKTRSTLPARLGERSAFKHSTFTSRLYRVLGRAGASTSWLVEGEGDTWTLSYHYQREVDVAVYGLPSGASTWRDDWLRDIKDSKVLMCFDNDEAGDRASEALANKYGFERVQVPSRWNDISDAYAGGWRPLP